ncbi:LysR family transcriptional regulator [Rhizobium tropici]|uniref:HTH-type transcriptional regulator TtuA n=2 Tax=Rhizobium tropici TaxID=398 RepID=A0A329YCX6_RHITR|nr:LysR family transcriptional regulator [Rhizobium tropici]
MISDAFDPRLLKAFVSVCSHGSINRAAAEDGRAQSALSTQIKRLEEVVGKQLLRRTGRGVIPTDAGEVMLAYAKRIIFLGEDAAARFQEAEATSELRIGLAETIAVNTLQAALGKIRRAMPTLQLSVTIDHGSGIAQRWADGALDIAIATCSAFSADPLEVWDVDLHWVCAIDATIDAERPLDVIVYAEPCAWRRTMFEKLMDADLEFRIALTSHNAAAMTAAVENGLGLALLTRESINPRTMRVVSSMFKGASPTVKYGLYTSRKRSHATDRVIDLLRQSVLSLSDRAAATV